MSGKFVVGIPAHIRQVKFLLIPYTCFHYKKRFIPIFMPSFYVKVCTCIIILESSRSVILYTIHPKNFI